jgi:hypothetical protein
MADVKSAFILGAGFSKAVCGTMPDSKELSDQIGSSFIKELPGFDIVKNLSNHLEDWLTYLSQDIPWMSPSVQYSNKSLYLTIVSNLKGILEEKQVQVRKGPISNVWKLMDYWIKNTSPLITLNYDTIVEEMYKTRGGRSFGDLYPFNIVDIDFTSKSKNQHYRGEGVIKLFKLHGSINWYYSGREDFYGETIYFQDYQINLESLSADEEKVRKLKAGKEVLIIPPVADKGFYYKNEIFRAMWTGAFYELYDCSRIYCIGYSFPPIDSFFKMFLIDSRAMYTGDRGKIEFVYINPDNESFKRNHEKDLEKSFSIRYIDKKDWFDDLYSELNIKQV